MPEIFKDKTDQIRDRLIMGIFIALILIPTFFTGEWNNWLVSFILIITCLLAVYVFNLYPQPRLLDFNKKIFKNPNAYLVGFLIIVIVSAFFSVSIYKSSSQYLLLIAYALIYLSAFKYFNFFSRTKILVNTIFYTGGLTAAISLIMYIVQSSSRAAGLLFNANALGSFLIFSLLIGLGLLFYPVGNKKIKILNIFVLLIIIMAFVLSFSYTAWFSVLLPIVLFIFYFRKKILTKKIILITIGVFVIIFLATVGFRYGRSGDIGKAWQVHETISTEHFNFSFEQRNNFNLAGLEIFADNPFIGTGYNTFQSVYGRYYKTVVEQPRYTHNYYIQTLSETGLFGFILFVGFLVLTFIYARRLYKSKSDDTEKKLYFIILLALAGSSMHAAFDFGWQFPAVFIPFWILAGTVNGQYAGKIFIAKENQESQGSNLIIKILFYLLIITLFARGMTLLLANYYYQQAELDSNIATGENIEYLHQGYKWDPNPNKLAEYANLKINEPSLTEQDFEQLENELLSVLAINDEEYTVQYSLGNVYFIQEKNDLAKEHYAKAIEYNPVFRPDYYYSLAFANYSEGNLSKAKEIVIDILLKYTENDITKSSNPNLDSQLSQLYLLKGQIYLDEGNIEKAKAYFEKAVDLNSNNRIASQKLNELY